MAAHAADLGMMFYTGRMFPQNYRGGVFNAQHGSWNRTTPVGARVMFTSLKEDGTADKTEVFAEGWLTADGEYLGRPVDVAQLPDGSLLVSDDFAGAHLPHLVRRAVSALRCSRLMSLHADRRRIACPSPSGGGNRCGATERREPQSVRWLPSRWLDCDAPRCHPPQPVPSPLVGEG